MTIFVPLAVLAFVVLVLVWLHIPYTRKCKWYCWNQNYDDDDDARCMGWAGCDRRRHRDPEEYYRQFDDDPSDGNIDIGGSD